MYTVTYWTNNCNDPILGVKRFKRLEDAIADIKLHLTKDITCSIEFD